MNSKLEPGLEITTTTSATCSLYVENLGTAAFLRQLSQKSSEGLVIIVDEAVAQLPYYQEAVATAKGVLKTIQLPSGETTKNLHYVEMLLKTLAEMDASRGTALVGIGGGVISDIVGFVAAIYRRGMPCYFVPTTLLAQIDASMGGKNGINMPYSKNAVGTFYAPQGIMIDIQWLMSLPEREFNAGLAEMVKYGVIADAGFFNELEQNADKLLVKEKTFLEKTILRCCEIKAAIVEADEREEQGLRHILNFGHTLGHAIETATHYQQFLHGEAVSIGMVQAARLSHKQRFISTEELQRIITILKKFALPTEIPDLSPEHLVMFMLQDKKK